LRDASARAKPESSACLIQARVDWFVDDRRASRELVDAAFLG
jgi:hypothetical protein